MGLQTGGHQALAAGTGTFGYEPNVNYLFGFPKNIKPGGVVFDIPLVRINATDDGQAEQLRIERGQVLQSNILPYNPYFDVPTAASFASSGGIPITSIVSGGQISKLRLEHIWVEAAIDFLPSRGARNRDADSWVEMDPSYKQYDYKKGLDAVAISGIDPEQLAQSFINSGTVNDSEGWASGFDAGILNNAQSEAQQKLEVHNIPPQMWKE